MSFTRALACPHDPGGSKDCPCRHLPRQGNSIFTLAELGEADALQRRLQSVDANVRDPAGYTALHFAAQHGRLLAAKELIKAGAEIDADLPGATPLMRAAFSGQQKLVKLLLKHGADAWKRDKSKHCIGETALHKAVVQGHHEVQKILLEHEPSLEGLIVDAEMCALVKSEGMEEARSHIAESSAALVKVQVEGFGAGFECFLCGKIALQMAELACCKKLGCMECVSESRTNLFSKCKVCSSEDKGKVS